MLFRFTSRISNGRMPFRCFPNQATKFWFQATLWIQRLPVSLLQLLSTRVLSNFIVRIWPMQMRYTSTSIASPTIKALCSLQINGNWSTPKTIRMCLSSFLHQIISGLNTPPPLKGKSNSGQTESFHSSIEVFWAVELLKSSQSLTTTPL